MAHSVLRKIAKSVHQNTHYALMPLEVTDLSNFRQFVICLRWVDDKTFVVIEHLIGSYPVDIITAATLFSSWKEVLLRLNLGINNCRSQCFDGTIHMISV